MFRYRLQLNNRRRILKRDEQEITAKYEDIHVTAHNLTTAFECVDRVLYPLAPFEFSARMWGITEEMDLQFIS